MDKTEMTEVVNGLCKKALGHRDATEAMKFSQAALNAANAYCSLAVLIRAREGLSP